MAFLYILLGIVVFLVAVLSIKITINGEFFESFKLNIKWLFINVQLIPSKPKKEKSPKKEKKKEAKDKEQQK